MSINSKVLHISSFEYLARTLSTSVLIWLVVMVTNYQLLSRTLLIDKWVTSWLGQLPFILELFRLSEIACKSKKYPNWIHFIKCLQNEGEQIWELIYVDIRFLSIDIEMLLSFLSVIYFSVNNVTW